MVNIFNSITTSQLIDVLDSAPDGEEIVTSTVSVPNLFSENKGPDTLDWLSTLTDIPIIYLSRPNQKAQYIAFGKYRELDNSGAEYLLNKLPDDNNLRLFGVNRFLNNDDDSKCRFKREYWVIPIIHLEITKKTISLTIVFDRKNRSDNQWLINEILGLIDQLKKVRESKSKKQIYLSKHHLPSKLIWESSVNKVKKIIQNNAIEKVVLARKTEFQFVNNVCPFQMIKSIQDEDPNVFHFCFFNHNEYSFIGGTPERLFEIYDHHIESEAIAGTRFKTDLSNLKDITDELVNSKKDRQEHQYVVDFIKQKLNDLSEQDVLTNEPSTIELKYLIHLIVKFSGHLSQNYSWLDCLNALHPTPAVAGTPRLKSMQIIQDLEPFSRGWYAGPVGMITKSSATILVAIRSGIIKEATVSLFSGAGIVKDSNPKDEWKELDAKISLFTSLFEGENR